MVDLLIDQINAIAGKYRDYNAILKKPITS